MRRRTVTARSAAALLATSLVLAGCGKDDGSDDPSSSGPEAQNVAAGAEIKARRLRV